MYLVAEDSLVRCLFHCKTDNIVLKEDFEVPMWVLVVFMKSSVENREWKPEFHCVF